MSKEINQPEFTGAKHYLNIPVEVALDRRVGKLELLLFGEILTACTWLGQCTSSNEELAKIVGYPVERVDVALKILKSFGYIREQNKTQRRVIVAE